MVEQSGTTQNATKSRTIGIVYLLYFVTVIGGTLIAPKLPVLGETVVFVSTLIYAVLAVLFYFLFKPVSQGVALLAAVLSVVGCVITELDTIHVAVSISPLLFFGPFNILIGYLIVRSTIVPRTLGVLMVLSGVAWLAFVVPSLTIVISTPAKVLGVAAEGLLMLWLLIVGVNTSSREAH